MDETPAPTPPSHFPAWCTERPCQGEHHADVDDPIPATGGLPRFARGGGVYFPSVQVALSWDTIDHLRPSVIFYVRSEADDCQVDLHLHEARHLLDALAEAIAALETSGVPA